MDGRGRPVEIGSFFFLLLVLFRQEIDVLQLAGERVRK
jgi:hypothetical protein